VFAQLAERSRSLPDEQGKRGTVRFTDLVAVFSARTRRTSRDIAEESSASSSSIIDVVVTSLDMVTAGPRFRGYVN